jgi:hypothetical protein
MSRKHERAVTLQRAQVVPVGPQSDIPIRAHRQQRDSFNPEQTRRGRFEIPDLAGQIATRSKTDGCLKQRRVCSRLLQNGIKIHKRWTISIWAGDQHQGMARAMSQLVKSAWRPSGMSINLSHRHPHARRAPRDFAASDIENHLSLKVFRNMRCHATMVCVSCTVKGGPN